MRDAEGSHMITEYFCKGLLTGLIFGAPAGAIGALTITAKIYRWLNCVLGCLMTGFGMVMVVQGIMK